MYLRCGDLKSIFMGKIAIRRCEINLKVPIVRFFGGNQGWKSLFLNGTFGYKLPQFFLQ